MTSGLATSTASMPPMSSIETKRHRMRIRGIRAVVASLLLSAVCMSVSGQDLLARQAPVDKKMKMVDSLSLRRMFLDRAAGNPLLNNLENPSSHLYPVWDNVMTRNYGVVLPREYNIDLRGFSMPCDSRVVTSHYGYRRSFGRNHYGTDIKVYVGDTIRAVFDGKVRIVDYEGRGYGNYVVIRHTNGLETVYGHMSKHLVRENQVVRSGQAIGLGGNTGRSTGSHLHIETRFLGQFIDPETIFDFAARDVKGDYYVYSSTSRGRATNNPSAIDNSPLLASAQDSRETGMASDVETLKVKVSAASQKVKEDKSRRRKEKTAQTERKSIHRVKQGDTLYEIARKYHTTVEKLCRVNRIKPTTTLRLGQVLKCS